MDIMKKDADMGPDNDKAAKMAVLKQIHKMATDAMGSDYMDKDSPDASMAHASVTASDPAGLKEGLAKAAEIVGKEGEPLDTDSMDEEEDSEDSADTRPGEPPAAGIIKDQIDHEASEGDMSDDEIESLIAELQARKRGK